jgi:hypothetical protein
MMAEISNQFADIIKGGGFEQADGALPGEGDAFADKTRLVFNFDMRSAGRLRMLINRLNDSA